MCAFVYIKLTKGGCCNGCDSYIDQRDRKTTQRAFASCKGNGRWSSISVAEVAVCFSRQMNISDLLGVTHMGILSEDPCYHLQFIETVLNTKTLCLSHTH